MDYGFAPGVDKKGGGNFNRELFRRRPNTTVIETKGVTCVKQLIAALNSKPTPIGDILIGTHANPKGQFSIPVIPGQNGETDYEMLESTLSDPSRSLVIPNTLIGFNPGDAVTRAVHIRGCAVGLAPPFLQKLREALGGNVHVTGPKFYHFVKQLTGVGSYEYLEYDFRIQRPAAFNTRLEALDAYKRANHTLIDGTTNVPDAAWEKLIPSDPNKSKQAVFDLPISIPLGERTTLPCERIYQTWAPSPEWKVTFQQADQVPTDPAAQLQALRDSLQRNHPLFQDTHPFPIWVREGFADFNAYIAGHTWKFTAENSATPFRLVCNGSRRVYSIRLPITRPAPAGQFFANGVLLWNFYPDNRDLLPSFRDLSATDSKFFTTV